MEWVKVKRLRPASDEPEVIIKHNRITFNVILDRLAELDKYSYVCIFSDDENRRLGFKFLRKKEEDSDAFKLSRAGSRGCWCFSSDLFSKNWVRKAAQNSDLNRFACARDDGMWTITLIPSFETSVTRSEAFRLGQNISGIYRYLSATGELVYIGKGNVKTRIVDKKRDDWKFDTVEYSIVSDDKEALAWERFYLDKFKNDNGGDLPLYNKINGHGQ